MLSWFPVDADVRNDPKIKVVRGRYGAAGQGYLLGLWSYIATEGSKSDPGVGVNSNGQALNLAVMAADLEIDLDAFRAFLDFLASVDLIDPNTWTQQNVIVLPAMRKRVSGYYKAKGRKPTGRGPGRPRKFVAAGPENLGEIREINFGNPVTVQDNSDGNSGKLPDATPAESATCGNPGKSGDENTKSGNSCSVLDRSSGFDLLGEDPDQDPDPRKGRLTPAKLVRLWNEIREPGPKVLELTDKRRVAYGRAIKAKPDVADWEQAIRYLNRAAWANAPGGEGTHANFRADLDYLARPGNVVKALERLAALTLPGARPERHTGRVAPTPGKYAGVAAAQKAEDAAARTGGGS